MGEKREDCKYTNHDSVFSPWKILIGPFDWEDYDSGKDGVERYRTHNLPKSISSPGLYELGIVASYSDLDHGVRRIESRHVIVVYLGQADNVRTRLQHYGRAGSHLEHRNSIHPLHENQSHCCQRGPGLFKDVFSRGFSIAYRWAQMDSKSKAEKTEAQLLSIFDYAWNKGGNGDRRREDILLVLDKIISRQSHLFNILDIIPDWKPHIFGRKRVGIKIDGCVPLEVPREKDQLSSNDRKSKLIPSVLKYSKSRPQLASGSSFTDQANVTSEVVSGMGQNKETTNSILGKFAGNEFCVCGVSLEDGSICLVSPVRGRKRCEMHKGRRVISTMFPSVLKYSKSRPQLASGSSFTDQANVTCEMVSGTGQNKETTNLILGKFAGNEFCVCGVSLEDGSICLVSPVRGRKRCEMHKGRRVISTMSMPQLIKLKLSLRKTKSVGGQWPSEDEHGIDGAFISNEITNTYPSVEIKKEDGKHSGKILLDEVQKLITTGDLDSPTCAVSRSEGSVCISRPVDGRERCIGQRGMHSGGSGSLLHIEKGCLTEKDTIICREYLRDGSICELKPVAGGKSCTEHKGLRSCRSNGSVFLDSLGMDYPICGVNLSNGSTCQNRPVDGRNRCTEHKGMRIGGLMSGSLLAKKEFAIGEQGSVCGVPLKDGPDGSICMLSPVPGRKRCERHKGRRVSMN